MMIKMIQDIEGDDESGDNHIDGDSYAESYDVDNDDHSSLSPAALKSPILVMQLPMNTSSIFLPITSSILLLFVR
jgi:hypothetical protein